MKSRRRGLPEPKKHRGGPLWATPRDRTTINRCLGALREGCVADPAAPDGVAVDLLVHDPEPLWVRGVHGDRGVIPPPLDGICGRVIKRRALEERKPRYRREGGIESVLTRY